MAEQLSNYVFISPYADDSRFETEEYDWVTAVRKFRDMKWDKSFPYAVFRDGVVFARLDAEFDARAKKLVPRVEIWPEARRPWWKFWR